MAARKGVKAAEEKKSFLPKLGMGLKDQSARCKKVGELSRKKNPPQKSSRNRETTLWK